MITINWQPNILEDNLIRLTPLTEYDFDVLHKVASDPLIWEQHPTKDRYKKEVFQLFFDEAVESHMAFLIIDKESSEIIGSTRYYDYKAETCTIAIGYTFLAKQYWGRQYNKSVKKMLLDYAFQFVDKVFFHVGSTNTRSQIAVSKIGALKVNEIDFDYYGKKVLHFEYLIEKTDWK
ncbi:GNAT family N-acetyltransferase [uncultured Cytophaga sp.]|uniref:GNAT family N-acetyltransferase n=1 Tax=uncultured Cytophaga sp. TaxID=160238 RepID=UPI00260C0190|nr:GNAT family N-acetyltransferase [uncultured Cytophaga sp.]